MIGVSRGRKKCRVGYLSVRGYIKKQRFNLFGFMVSPSFLGYNLTRLAAARGLGITGSVHTGDVFLIQVARLFFILPIGND